MTDEGVEGIVRDGEFLFVRTVYTAPGALRVHGGDSYAKARIWVLANRDVYIVSGAGGGEVVRTLVGQVASMTKTAKRQLDITLEDGSTVQLTEASCGCGMGAVSSAGPVEGPWRIERVRTPEWFDALAYTHPH